MPAVSKVTSENSTNMPVAVRKFKRMMTVTTIVWIIGIFVMTVWALIGTGWVAGVMGHDAATNAHPPEQRAGYLAGKGLVAIMVGTICPTIPYVATMVGLCLCKTSAKKTN